MPRTGGNAAVFKFQQARQTFELKVFKSFKPSANSVYQVYRNSCIR